MNQYSTEELRKIVEQFNNRTLPKNEWTHQAHIIIAIWHNMNFEVEEALQLVKSKIIAYNETVGTPNTNSSGYHETLTRFWMISTRNFIQNEGSFESNCHEFLNSDCASKEFPLQYYSREKLFSTEARMKFIDGDLKTIL